MTKLKAGDEILIKAIYNGKGEYDSLNVSFYEQEITVDISPEDVVSLDEKELQNG